MVNCDVGAPGPRGRAAGRRSVTVVAPPLSLSLRWKSYSHTDKVWCNNEEQSHCQEAFWKLGYSVSKCQCLYSGLEFSKWYKVTNMICSVYVNTFSGGLILIWWHHFRISFLFFGYRPRLRLMQKKYFSNKCFFFIRVNYFFPLFLIICPNVWWWWFLNNVSLVSSKLGPKSTISGSRSRKSSSRIMIEPQPVMDRLCCVGL